jgi:hypothetical protein
LMGQNSGPPKNPVDQLGGIARTDSMPNLTHRPVSRLQPSSEQAESLVELLRLPSGRNRRHPYSRPHALRRLSRVRKNKNH